MATEEPQFLLSISVANSSKANLTSKYDLVSGISGGICFLIVLILLILAFVYKAYKTTLLRLILYHIIISLLCELTITLFIFPQFYFQVMICTVLFYVRVYIINSWIVYTTVITNFLLIFTCTVWLRNSPRIWRKCIVAECISLISALSVPAFHIWIPIVGRENTTCNKHFTVGRVLNTVYLIMDVELVFVSITMCCLFCFLRCRYQYRQPNRLPNHLLCYALTNTVLLVFGALFAISSYLPHQVESISVVLDYMSNIGFPFLILISTIVLSLLAIQPNYKYWCGKICHRMQKVDENVNETQDATNPSSHPINQPSHTYFSIQYTGAFTQVTANSHCDNIGESTPLV